MAEGKKDDTPKKETESTRTGDVASSLGDAFATLHEQGKADRRAMRDMAKDIGADMMDEAKDVTGKMADAATQATKDTAHFTADAASVFGSGARQAAEAAGDFATKATDAAGKVATSTVDMAGKAAQTAAEAAENVGDKVGAAVNETAEEATKRAQESAAEWQDRFMRLHAEWDTYRRRTTEQRAEEKTRANEDLVTNLLPVLDDFERSIEYAVKNGEGDLLNGVQQVHSKLVDVLQKSGVDVIDPVGEPYDALESQAVAKVDKTDVPDETVDQVYQKGYKMGKKVIRPATVTVTSGGPKREKKAEEDSDADASKGESK